MPDWNDYYEALMGEKIDSRVVDPIRFQSIEDIKARLLPELCSCGRAYKEERHSCEPEPVLEYQGLTGEEAERALATDRLATETFGESILKKPFRIWYDNRLRTLSKGPQ